MSEITLKVEGMHCGGCENTVRTVVGALDGVRSVDADHTSGCVTIETNGDVDVDTVRSTITDAGYNVVD